MLRRLGAKLPQRVIDRIKTIERAVMPIRWRVAGLVSWPLRWAPDGPIRRVVIRAVCLVWGNRGYSASVGLCLALDELATSGVRVLELGSGVTTLLLRRNRRLGSVSTIEHDAEWFEAMSRALPEAADRGLDLRPIIALEPGLDWYDLDLSDVGSADLILCDGPPSMTTDGGRAGLLWALERTEQAVTVVIDDVDRPSERRLMDEMLERLGAVMVATPQAGHRPYGVVRIPARSGGERGG